MRVLRNLTARSLLTARCYPPELSLFPEPSIVDGDSQRSNQVFANLLDNAEPGTVAPAAPVSVCVERRDDHASVRVQDRGIGIDLTMLPRISICASRRTARSIVRKGLSACPLSRSQSENENNSVLTEAGAPGVNQTVS
jgi:light-regulated signal transduction histidine kinase (bacteriophytochrome)